MANKDDIETARELGGLHEWKEGVNKTLDSHHIRIGEVEKCQQAITNARKVLIPYMTIGALTLSVVCLGVFSLYDPANAKEILKSLIPPFISALRH